MNEAYRIGQDEQFQQVTKEAVQAVQNQSHTQNDEDSRKRSDSISQSWENAQSLRTEASKSFRESEDLQKQAAWIQSNASTINTNFTQQALEGVANMPADNARGRIGMQGVAHMAAHNPELLQKYVSHWASHHGMNVPASPELKPIENSPSLEQSYRAERRHLQEQTPSHELGNYQLQTPSAIQGISSLGTRQESSTPYKNEISYPEMNESLLKDERGTHLDTIGKPTSLQEQSNLSGGGEGLAYSKAYIGEKGSVAGQTLLHYSSSYPFRTVAQNQGQTFIDGGSNTQTELGNERMSVHNDMSLASGPEKVSSNSRTIPSEHETSQQLVQKASKELANEGPQIAHNTSLASGPEEKGNRVIPLKQEASQQSVQASSPGLTHGEPQTAHKAPVSRSEEIKPQNERPARTHSINKKPLGLNSEKIEKLNTEVNTMQNTSSEAIKNAEKQHEQQRVGIEKEFHKKGKKNLLRVAAKAEVKNLADTVASPFEGIGNFATKLVGESQKKP